MILPVNAIMKITRDGNLSCKYCHNKQPNNSNMPFEQLALAIDRILSIESTNSFRFI